MLGPGGLDPDCAPRSGGGSEIGKVTMHAPAMTVIAPSENTFQIHGHVSAAAKS